MIGSNNAAALVGGTVIDEDGEKIGTVGQLYVDPVSGQPNWITVKTGWFGTSETFVPLRSATAEGDTIRVPYAKDFVKEAPRVDTAGPLGQAEEQRLYAYYSIVDDAEPSSVDRNGATGAGMGDSSLTDDPESLSHRGRHVGTGGNASERADVRNQTVSDDQIGAAPVTRVRPEDGLVASTGAGEGVHPEAAAEPRDNPRT